MSRTVQYAFRLISEGVPLFMAVNGILMFRKPELDLKRHLMKTLRLFVLLLVWCVILTVAGLMLERDPKPVTLHSLVHFTLLTQVGSEYTGVLWFLQGMLAVYLMFPVLKAAYLDGSGWRHPLRDCHRARSEAGQKAEIAPFARRNDGSSRRIDCDSAGRAVSCPYQEPRLSFLFLPGAARETRILTVCPSAYHFISTKTASPGAK